MSRGAPRMKGRGENKELDTSSMSRLEVEVVKTGIIPLDTVLGGGVPKGDMVEISSPSGVGKCVIGSTVVCVDGVIAPIHLFWSGTEEFDTFYGKVETIEGSDETDSFYSTVPEADLIKITTSCGANLTGTQVHPVEIYNLDTGTFEWVNLEDVKLGDLIRKRKPQFRKVECDERAYSMGFLQVRDVSQGMSVDVFYNYLAGLWDRWDSYEEFYWDSIGGVKNFANFLSFLGFSYYFKESNGRTSLHLHKSSWNILQEIMVKNGLRNQEMLLLSSTFLAPNGVERQPIDLGGKRMVGGSKFFQELVQVVEVEFVPPVRVFDFSIPKTHKFLANGFSCHNTTLLLAATKAYRQKGYRVAYFDVERGVKKPILNNFGLLDEVSHEIGSELLLLSPETYDDLELLFDEVVIKDPYDLIVVDSITTVLPAKMKEKRISEIEIGLEARQMSSFVKKYKPELRNGGTTVFLINQMRTKIDTSFGGKTELTSAGGNALMFVPDVRLRMEAGPQMKRIEKTINGDMDVVFGNNARIWAEKNRNERSHIKVNIPIIFGRGVSNIMVVTDLAKAAGLVSGGGGGFFKVGLGESEQETVRGTPELNKWIKDNYQLILDYLEERGLMRLTQGEVL